MGRWGKLRGRGRPAAPGARVMSESLRTLHTRVQGRWNPRHTFFEGDDRLGVLTVRRNGFGMVVAGEYRPEKGEVLLVRRDPGLLRAQFSIWTDSREWLGSSLRWHVARRQVDVWTGGRPYRIVPARGFRRGWRLVASKTGETARIEPRRFGRDSTITLHRKMDFELVLFAYFLGSVTLNESFFPSSLDIYDPASSPATPSKA